MDYEWLVFCAFISNEKFNKKSFFYPFKEAFVIKLFVVSFFFINFGVSISATFTIIKKLLPAKAVECLKFINLKTIKQYVSEDNMLACWGGKDTYEYTFVPEKENLVSDSGTDRKKNNIITNGVLKNSVNGVLHHSTNNNVQEQNNLNLQQRKVSRNC